MLDLSALEESLKKTWMTGESKPEHETTLWWILRSMGVYLDQTAEVQIREERLIYNRFAKFGVEWLLSHAAKYNTKYLRWEDKQLTVHWNDLLIEETSNYPLHHPSGRLILPFKGASRSEISLAMFRLWKKRRLEIVNSRPKLVLFDDLKIMASRVFSDVEAVLWSRLPMCARKVGKTQLAIQCKVAGAPKSTALSLVADSGVVAKIYSASVFCHSCATIQSKGACPFADIEDLAKSNSEDRKKKLGAAAEACRRDYLKRINGKRRFLEEIGTTSPEKFLC